MRMPRFSLIVATLNRNKELAALLTSLAEQQTNDFELIVVDQNSDDRLVPLLKEWEHKTTERNREQNSIVQVKHLRTAPGLSRARNLALEHSTGEILAFPDDDCWYLPGTLQFVDEWFRENPEYGILSLGSRDRDGRISNNRWFQSQCDLTRFSAFRASATYTYFVHRPSQSMPLKFDESIGPGAGTPFGAGEDTDFMLTLMAYGIRTRFYSDRYIGHPFKPYASVERAESYGSGFGRILAKHSLPFLCFGLIVFDFARAVIRFLLGDRSRAERLWAHGRGMIRAYLSSTGNSD